ncbi:MAG: hypothetical protein V4719_20330, partial [Planctomycetota bacterium]
MYELNPDTGKAKLIHEVADSSLAIVAFSNGVVCLREGADGSKPRGDKSGRLIGVSLDSPKVTWDRFVNEAVYGRYFDEEMESISARRRSEYRQRSDESPEGVLVDGEQQERRIVGFRMQDGSELWSRPLGIGDGHLSSIPIARGRFVVYTTLDETVVLERSSGKDVFKGPSSGRFVIEGNDLYVCTDGWTSTGAVPFKLWHADLNLKKMMSH